jgi:mRNA interferase MazF
MITEGQIVLFRFPQTDQQEGKLRPALVLRKVPGPFNDWLICVISFQLHQPLTKLDEAIYPEDGDFAHSGLKQSSDVRASRLAVVDGRILMGSLGTIGTERLARIRERLASWLQEG